MELKKIIVNAEPVSREQLKKIWGGNNNFSLEDIRRYRDEKCLTQEYMANQLGIGQSAYHKIENGTVKVSIDRLKQIASILKKPIDVFFNNSNSSTHYKTISIAQSEYDLIQTILQQQEHRITELEEKICRKNKKIEELKKLLSGKLH
ncbi:helix-turn-helix transcriptional regulator [Pedobacter sp. UBA4863]|uniref:helix-turn-helix domain-containing protein n=1 Tax=Pedobacter sp. UBA4863 TaxID=1947060 RepID=UPI0025F396F8|nr:helix-turn-helix transcriptional regulator [Pedobacter sp. UBA4863]